MPKRYEVEDEVDSGELQDLYDASVPAYADDAARDADYINPITDLRVIPDLATIPDGKSTSVGGTNRSFAAYNTNEHKPWRRLTLPETGLIQAVVEDAVVAENVSGVATCRFKVWLVNARANIANFTDPTYTFNPIDLQGRVVALNVRAVEYDPRPYGERTRPNLNAEARLGIDFEPVSPDQVTVVWTDQDESIFKFINVLIPANREDRAARPDGTVWLERFQLELYAFDGIKPLKDIGIGTIASGPLPQLRIEDVTISTDRLSSTDTNIGAKTYTITPTLNQAPGVDINLRLFTEDGTAVASATRRDYEPFNVNTVIRADATQPATPITGRLPNQILEETEHFFVRALPLAGQSPPVLFVKPRARVTIEGRALEPTLYADPADYGPGFGGGRPTELYMTLRMNPAPTAESGPVTVWAKTNDEGDGLTFGQPNYHYVPLPRTAYVFGVGETEKQLQVNCNWSYSAVSSSVTGRPAYEYTQDVAIRVDFEITNNAQLGTSFQTFQLYGETSEDVLPPFTVTGARVVEGNPVVVRSRLGTIPNIPASIEWRILTGIVDGANLGNAESGVHYNPAATSGIKRYARGARNLAFNLTIPTIVTPGSTAPNPRFFTVEFFNPVGMELSGPDNRVRVTCIIEDSAGVISNPLLTGPSPDLVITEPFADSVLRTFTFTLSDKPSGNTAPYFWDYATGEGTARSGINYASITRTRAMLSASGTDFEYDVILEIYAAGITEPKTFFIGAGSAGVQDGQQSGNLDIASNRFPITIRPRRRETTTIPSMSVSDVVVNDDEGEAELTLRLSQPAPRGAEVTYNTQDSSAKAGTHYTAQRNVKAQWQQGSRDLIIAIPIFADESNTNNHTFRVLFSQPRNITIDDNRADVTIRNTGSVRPPPEPEAPPALRINNGSIQVPTGANASGNLTISTSRNVDYSISGTFSLWDGTSGNRGVAGTHYVDANDIPFTLPANQSSVPVPYTVLPSGITSDYNFRMIFELDDDQNASISDSTGIITITAQPEPPTISVGDVDLTESSRTGNANVVITRTGDDKEIMFYLQTVRVSGSGGAIPNTHFTPLARTRYTMASGVNTLTVGIPLVTPGATVPTQTFIVRADGATPSDVVISKSDGLVTLPSYTAPSTGRVVGVELIAGPAVREPGPTGSANSIFTIQLSGAAPDTISGDFWTEFIQSATPNVDYTGIPASNPDPWSVGRGATSTTVSVPILHDTVQEGRERFRGVISLDSGVPGRFQNVGDDRAVGLIDNRAATTGISLAIPLRLTMVRGATANLRVTRSGVATFTTTGQLSTYSTGSATSEDYQILRNRGVSIPSNEGFVDVPIISLSPNQEQGEETFGVSLSSVSPSGVALGNSTTEITLLPSESTLITTAPIISVQGSRTQLTGALVVTASSLVLLPTPSSRPTTIDYTLDISGIVGTSRLAREIVTQTRRLTIPARERAAVAQVSWRFDYALGTTTAILTGLFASFFTFGFGGLVAGWGIGGGAALYGKLGILSAISGIIGSAGAGVGVATITAGALTATSTVLLTAATNVLLASDAAGDTVIAGVDSNLPDEDKQRMFDTIGVRSLSSSISYSNVSNNVRYVGRRSWTTTV